MALRLSARMIDSWGCGGAESCDLSIEPNVTIAIAEWKFLSIYRTIDIIAQHYTDRDAIFPLSIGVCCVCSNTVYEIISLSDIRSVTGWLFSAFHWVLPYEI